MRTLREVGIIGYGAYIPMYRIKTSEMAGVWGKDTEAVPIKEKSVPGPDEDAVTIGIEAARNALRRSQIHPERIKAVWTGSESKPYAVKPSSTIIAEAIGATPEVDAADWEFACKAGTEAMQACFGLVGSGMANYAMALGVDTAQGKPADHLEYTAAAGGAAFLIGRREESIAYLEASYSYVTDTPDFFRRQHTQYPEHGNRFTGAPAYFNHIICATKNLMELLSYTPEDYDLVVFHQPNTKFPIRVAKILGFEIEKVIPGLVIPYVGNTYAGSSLIGFASTLDGAKPGDKILCVSYGSGAGSDAFSFVVTDLIEERRNLAPKVKDYVERRVEIGYAIYSRFRKKYRLY
ncbi:MAG: hydroxymethylglutaryl-CoA synthase [Candidatus Methanofastidiosia archaeon]